MNGQVWEAVIAGAASLAAILGVCFGIPQWRMSRRALEAARKADRSQELLEAARIVLLGDKPPQPPSPENPSIVDLLKDMRALLAEQADLSAIIWHHIADGHGAELPPWITKPQRHEGR